MRTIHMRDTFQDIMKNIDLSSEASYHHSLDENIDDIKEICQTNNLLDTISGIAGFEKEKALSLAHVKKINNPKNISYENVDEIKKALYLRAKKRLDKRDEEPIIINTPRELTRHIVSVAMAENEKKATITLAKDLVGKKRPWAKNLKRGLDRIEKIKNANSTLVTGDMVGYSIGEVFGEVMVGIFDEENGIKKKNRA